MPARTVPDVLPLVPLMVRVLVPAGVVAAVATFRVVVAVDPDARVTVAGENVPVAPEGSPASDRLTAPLNPPVEVADTV